MAGNQWLTKRKDKKCDYVLLSPGEIKKLRNNGHEPHDLKPKGSKDDLFKCKASGKVVVKRKTKYQDKDGKWVYPPDDEVDDTCINIDALPWKPKPTSDEQEEDEAMEEAILEFCVSGFDQPPDEVLKNLPIMATSSWVAGDPRTPRTILKHDNNGFRVSAQRPLPDFEDGIEELLRQFHPLQEKLATLGAECQLSCIFYLSGSQRPIISLSKEVMHQLADLDASVDVDVYYMSDEEAEAEEQP